MQLLYSYLRQYKPLIALALVLATINQVFSLLDPLIFRYVIDRYATRYQEYSTGEFFRGVTLLLGAAVGVAFVSRVAKNFQDYFINVVTQRLGAQMYADGGAQQQAHPLEELAGRVLLETGRILVDDMAENQRVQERKHLVDGRQYQGQRHQAPVLAEVPVKQLHICKSTGLVDFREALRR